MTNAYRPQIYNPITGQMQRSPAGSFTEADGIVQPAIAQTLTANTAIAPVASMIAISSVTAIVVTATPAITSGIDPNKFQGLTLINTGNHNITLQDESVLAGSGLRLLKNNWVIRPSRSLTLLYRGGAWQQLLDGEILSDTEILDAILRVDADNAGINATTLQGTLGSGFLRTANNLSDLNSRSAARSNLEASSPFWNAGEIRGVPVSPITPLHQQALVFNATTNQYVPAALVSSGEIRGTLLTGLSTSSAVPISEADSILSAFGKLQAQIPQLNVFSSEQPGLVPSPGNGSGRFLREDRTWQIISGGGSGGTTLGENTQPIAIAPNGAVNIWTGQRHAVPQNRMSAGSLTLGRIDGSYGQGFQENSNMAALMLECLQNSEIAIHHSNTRYISLLSYQGSPNRISFGRNMGWGIPQEISIFGKRIGFFGVNPSFSSDQIFTDGNDRTHLAIISDYSHLSLFSGRNNISETFGSTIQMGGLNTGSSNIYQRWGASVAANNCRSLDIFYYEGSDQNPHTGTRNWGAPSFLSFIGANKSQNGVLGDKVGIGFYLLEPQYNLHLHQDLSIGFGTNGLRTEIKNDASAMGRLASQSGFFETPSPVNFYPGASSWQHLIDCRHSNPGNLYALQIAASFNTNSHDSLWWRSTAGDTFRPWNRFLSVNSNNESGGWLSKGNNNIDSSHFIGTINNTDLIFRRNNTEAFRISSHNTIQMNVQSGYGNGVRPRYAFYGGGGEDDGMDLEADGVLFFATQGIKRLSVNAQQSRIEAHGFPFQTDQGYFVNNDRVINVKSPTAINTLAGGASLADVINILNSLIIVLRDHHDLFT